LEAKHNAAIEAFSSLSCFGIPVIRGTKPQVFTGSEADFPLYEQMGMMSGKTCCFHPPAHSAGGTVCVEQARSLSVKLFT